MGTGVFRRAGWVWLLLGLSLTTVAWASTFKVQNATTRLERGVYKLYAKIDYTLSKAPLEALHNGVPLTFRLQMEVLRKREWLWDETVASFSQLYELEYHVLARQYVVTNHYNDERKSFPDAGSALSFLGDIRNLPFLDAGMLQADETYYGRVRVSLDLDNLPAPLLLVAYLSEDWFLNGNWYTWPM
ncbi:MAG: DUF4390 domain-containing protein [Gammaproteobacteria bacterium]|nr:DUF4390 domain-containing protein [Gammaproteobacteria bacterium]